MAERDGASRGIAHGSVKPCGASCAQPSIKDIARLAHVSHPRFRGAADSPLVNAETAAKIRKIAEEQGYAPGAVARGLVTRRTRPLRCW